MSNRRMLWSLSGVVALLGMLLPAAAPLGVPPPPVVELPDAIQTPLPMAAAVVIVPPTSLPDVTSTPLPGTPQPSGDAQADLALALATLEDFSPQAVSRAMGAFFEAVGYNLGPGDGVFEENNTLSFSYNVGDVNADGTDDVGLDQYCTSLDGCVPAAGTSSPVDIVNAYLHPAGCPGANAHRLLAVSGVDGGLLWSERIDEPRWLVEPVAARPYSCALEFVVGAVPVEGNRTGLLVYRWSIAYPLLTNVMDVQNDLYLVDPLDGHTVWRYSKPGLLVGAAAAGVSVTHVENLYVVPILQVPPTEGVRVVPTGTQTALFVQVVSWDAATALAPFIVPGQSGTYPILDAYRPNERAARIDPLTGDVLWDMPTFTPQGTRSVLPHALATQYGPACPIRGAIGCAPVQMNRLYLSQPDAKASLYWSVGTCCYDSTGDGVPDLLFWTHEWSGTPVMNPDGPYMVASHARLYDGAAGSVLWDVELQEDTFKERSNCTGFGASAQPFCLMVWPQITGDTTGDGRTDILFHAVFNDADYSHRLILLNGPDGREVWTYARAKNVDVLVVGDINGDRANDLVTYEWFNTNTWFVDPNGYSAANVTATPVIARDGATGNVLWRATTFSAPADLRVLFDVYRSNGLPDLDGDGVGDVPIDDPIYYPDLTVVHRVTFLSSKSAAPLFTVHTVGAFAFPARAGDLTGDGVDDLVMINGDVNDLWFTTYDGHGGDSIWSRRALTLRSSNYMSATVRMRTHALHLNGLPGTGLLVNVHFSIHTIGGGIFTPINNPQLAAYRGLNGTSRWAIPVLQDADFTAVVQGATPLAALYEQAYADPRPTPMSVASYAPPVRATLGLGLFSVAACAAFGLTQWRRP